MISIIIPAHNEEKNLKKLIPKLENCISEDLEIELLLAISPETGDDSQRVKLPAYGRIFQCKGQGRAVQMNEAAAIAQGDILVFLHADVFPPQEFTKDIRTSFQMGYQAGFFSYRFDSDHRLLKINAFFTARDGIFTGGGDQCLFIKKTVFEKLGGFDEQQVLMEDFEFFRRMKREKVRYRIVRNDLLVSARKYEFNSYWKVNFTNLTLLFLFRLGYPSCKLRSLYRRMLHLPYADTQA